MQQLNNDLASKSSKIPKLALTSNKLNLTSNNRTPKTDISSANIKKIDNYEANHSLRSTHSNGNGGLNGHYNSTISKQEVSNQHACKSIDIVRKRNNINDNIGKAMKSNESSLNNRLKLYK